jgi:hypothetical protein
VSVAEVEVQVELMIEEKQLEAQMKGAEACLTM